MYIQYRGLKLIQESGRPDEDNKDILDGKYDNSEIPLTYKERMAKIFSDWQQGDILVIADSPLKHPKLQGDTLVEMTREEVCESGDLSVLDIGEVYQKGAIIKKEKPSGVKIEWIYPNWIETATQTKIELDKTTRLYNEYKPLDTPSIVAEMELQNETLATEFKNLMIELRRTINQLKLGITTISDYHEPSDALKQFKDSLKPFIH